eukprot:CAMPEP_0194109230 /NCGR_PEP_ID=MMETSP0150-20130528/8761_1 /TAXON_ID=122233 /ORGANISM="Chaetoceros debilis, Strain MM31A-1" /LENGTH=1291 /DNA_ID=CAMNT_0038798141 /DNA_START=50 /DNA_END=3925 /DNA_ORIENTATION=+
MAAASAAAAAVWVIVYFWYFTSLSETAKNHHLEDDPSSAVPVAIPLLRRIYNLYYDWSPRNTNIAASTSEWIQSQKMVFLSHLNLEMNMNMNMNTANMNSMGNIYAIYQSFLLIISGWTRAVYQSAISRLGSSSRRNRNHNTSAMNMNAKFKSPKTNQRQSQAHLLTMAQNIPLRLGNKVSVYHRIGQACDPSERCSDSDADSDDNDNYSILGSTKRSNPFSLFDNDGTSIGARAGRQEGKGQKDIGSVAVVSSHIQDGQNFRNEEVSSSPYDSDSDSDSDLYPGLVLYVYHSEDENEVHSVEVKDDRYRSRSPTRASTSNSKPSKSPSSFLSEVGVDLYQPPCCNMQKNENMNDAKKLMVSGAIHRGSTANASSSGSAKDMNQYELTRVIREDLGTSRLHSHDYAYRPVVKMPLDNSNPQQWQDDEWWWYTHADSEEYSNDDDDDDDTSEEFEFDYERVGARAFAGGSHGEVWAARRRCNQLVNFDEHEHNHNRDESRPNNEHGCDDGQELIMKRLKVGLSYELMEAGLREIYFGDILSRSEGSGELFTKYIDHFFRRGHGNGHGRGRGHGLDSSRLNSDGDDLELWIVFENAGPSLRSYLYTPFSTDDFVIYQHSDLWVWLRTGVRHSRDDDGSKSVAVVQPQCLWEIPESDDNEEDKSTGVPEEENSQDQKEKSKDLLKSILRQILTSAAKLHERGIVHRDIKPSNVMCKADSAITYMNCVLGDFSSGYDEFSAERLYSRGPSAHEQTDEYAPPEVLFGSDWIPFYEGKQESYDSWSIGVVALELLLGSPNVFSVDKRTAAVLTSKLKRERTTDDDIRRALYLAALSQFCIYNPTHKSDKDWPLGQGDPLEFCSMAKTTCTIHDFHNALRARDPLGLGFSDTLDPLLQLIWGLLAWDPKERLTASEALQHHYFTMTSNYGQTNALQPQVLDPRLDINTMNADLDEFRCPKCGRIFDNLLSCQQHTVGRRHAQFCTYDRSNLPKCLNAHSMLPSHPTSGYCDIQGRRQVIEDFHTVHLHDNHQFYGVFDGHNGNLASKYASAAFYKRIVKPLSDVDDDIRHKRDWKSEVESEMGASFSELHMGVLEAMKMYPGESMSKSGTTASILFVSEHAVIIASVGDSRAVLSFGGSYNETQKIGASQLTVDHKASNKLERERVESLGGFVAKVGGTHRVNGTLVLTRSIGDAHLARYLSRTPHVISMTKDEVKKKCGHSADDNFPCFIILASDGLWDEMSNEEAVAMVESVLRRYGEGDGWKERGGFQEAAEVLTQEAYVRGSSDNIGVCVVAIT